MTATSTLAPKAPAAKPKSAPSPPKMLAPKLEASPALKHPQREVAPPSAHKVTPPALPSFARVPAAMSAQTKSEHPSVPSLPATPKIAAQVEKPVPPAARHHHAVPTHPHPHGLPVHIQDALTHSLGMDFEGVQVHVDSRAQSATSALSARAFAYGNHIFLGPHERIGDLALIAHEAAHVVQQNGVPTVQRSAAGHDDVFEREAERASAAVMRGEKFRVQERVSAPQVQRWGISDALDKFAGWADRDIPGFSMFTMVLGVNPINMQKVVPSTANMLRALVKLIPGGGLIVQALDKYQVIDKVANWLDGKIKELGMVGSSFKKAIDDFLHSLKWSDILDLGGVWDRAKKIFTEPIDRLTKFASGLADDIIKFIKDAILLPLAKLAEGTRGWDLLCAVLQKNPITGEKVERNAETLIGGFMKLIGKEEVWQNLKQAKAVERAWAWFQKNVDVLIAFVTQLPTLFSNVLKALSVSDIMELPAAFKKVAGIFADFGEKFAKWGGDAVWQLLQIIFEVLAPGAIPYLKRLGAALKSILQNPIGFVSNLVKAGILGFQNFADNFWTHLKASFIEWLTGAMTGVYLPKSLDFKEILMFVLSVLGLTWQNIRGKLVKVLGETAVKVLETGFDIVVTLVKEGPGAAWEKIKEHLNNLKDMVMQGIMDFIVDTVVKKAVAKIISLLVPGGAFIQAIISIYDTIMVFVDKLSKIVQVVKTFLDSMIEIAEGQVAGAAKKVESTLAGLLTLVISFLAGFLGLGKIADKVMAIIQKIRDAIDKAIDKVIDWIVTMAKKLGGAIKGAAGKLVEWWKTKVSVKSEDESHELYFQGTESSAELVIASSPMPLEAFLDDRESKATSEQKKAIAEIRKGLKTVKDLLRKTKAEQDETFQKQVETEMNAIGQKLVTLLSGAGWGTEANPAPLKYEKRRSAAYPVLYLATGNLKRLRQDTLQERLEQGQDKDKIWKYRPNDQQGSPGGEKTLGLDESSQIEVGRKLEFDEKGKREGGVGEFKSLVGKYGLTPSDYGWDVDHVIELQIGGHDQFDNLWPLPSGENRSSGSLIKNAKTKDAKGNDTTVADAYASRKGKSLWLIVTSTNQR